MSSRDQFRWKPAIATVPTPDFGEVTIRALTANDYLSIGEGEDEASEGMRQSALLIVRSVCDDAGNRIFSDSDVGEIAGWPLRSLNAVLEGIHAHNRMGKAVEGKLTASDLPSRSPNTSDAATSAAS